MDAQEIGLTQEGLEVDQLRARLLGSLRGHQRVVRDDPHLEPLGGDPRHLESDLAESEQPQGLLPELRAHEGLAIPPPCVHRRVSPRDVAGQHEHHPDGVLRRRDGVAGRSVQDQHPVPRRSVEIDVVHPDPGSSDDPEPRSRLEHLGGHLGLAADHQRVDVGDPGLQFLQGQPGRDHDLAGSAQPLHPVGRDGVGDQDADGGGPRRGRGGHQCTPAGSALATPSRAIAWAAGTIRPTRLSRPSSLRASSR